MRKKKEVTLHHIAEELKLSLHTVSKALRGLPGMSESTRRQVFETARRLGYKTKEQELSVGYEKLPLLSTKQRRFTMIMTQETPFFRVQFQGLQERMQEWGHTMTATFLPPLNTEMQSWLAGIDLEYYDGVIIPPAIQEEIERLLLQLPLPKVLINYPPPLANVDSVIWDVLTAVHQSVHYLHAMGHERILYIGDIYRHRGFRLRWQAFCEAMGRIGIVPQPEQHMTVYALPSEQWMSELQHKLIHGKYSAILCAVQQDLSAVMYALQKINLNIPEHISLVSVEDMENKRFPQLSRPLLLMQEAGRRAAERLLWRIANPHEPFEYTRLQGTFFPGSTVQPYR
ncbi:LacI family DNA-binding transcriptional regulator [Paenibacillus sp. GCM10027626]|uniref:LacI family DNA-binding transcriptional regulator n=1 Tax=Paenibacillus sp. GCM10027626 TaxID=3273411 RepID=UPI00362B28A2